jgi:hypothetical protein
VMLSCKGLCERGLSRMWGLFRLSRKMRLERSNGIRFESLTLQTLQGSIQGTTSYGSESGVFHNCVECVLAVLPVNSRPT